MTAEATAKVRPASPWLGPTFASRLRARLPATPDLFGYAVAFLYGMPSLFYVFGRDQAIFFYVGREWLRGRLVYRDAFDVKPPGVYFIYALSAAIFGSNQRAIRLAELIGVLAMGALASRAVRRTEPARPGEAGLCAILAAGWYYTPFDYWDTGQAEFWEGLCLLGSYVAALTDTRLRRAAFVSGALTAFAVLCKPTAALVGAAIAVIVSLRALDSNASPVPLRTRAKESAVVASLHACGAFAVVSALFLYFALRGGLQGLRDWWGYTAHYLAHKATPRGVERAWFMLFWRDRAGIWLLATAVGAMLSVSVSYVRRDWKSARALLVVLLLAVLAVGSVCVQRKFWSYHWVVVVPFLVLAGGYGVAAAARLRRWLPFAFVALALSAAFVGAPYWFANGMVTYRFYTGELLRYAWHGARERPAFVAQFVGVFGYSYPEQEAIGGLVRGRARPGDLMHVRGFEPTIYAVAGLASPSRFASEAPLTDPTLAFHRAAWLAEHERALWTARPRFIVSFIRSPDVQEVTRRGYHAAGSAGRFVLLERDR